MGTALPPSPELDKLRVQRSGRNPALTPTQGVGLWDQLLLDFYRNKNLKTTDTASLSWTAHHINLWKTPAATKIVVLCN